jgi:hypothetical protein
MLCSRSSRLLRSFNFSRPYVFRETIHCQQNCIKNIPVYAFLSRIYMDADKRMKFRNTSCSQHSAVSLMEQRICIPSLPPVVHVKFTCLHRFPRLSFISEIQMWPLDPCHDPGIGMETLKFCCISSSLISVWLQIQFLSMWTHF